MQAGVEAGENATESGLLDDLRLIGYALEAGSMAEFLQGAFQCAWPGFSAEFARAIAHPVEATVYISFAIAESLRIMHENCAAVGLGHLRVSLQLLLGVP